MLRDDFPNYFRVAIVIIMNQNIAHGDYLTPRNVGKLGLHFVGHVANVLADLPDIKRAHVNQSIIFSCDKVLVSLNVGADDFQFSAPLHNVNESL